MLTWTREWAEPLTNQEEVCLFIRVLRIPTMGTAAPLPLLNVEKNVYAENGLTFPASMGKLW